jgi:hypothetical protein
MCDILTLTSKVVNKMKWYEMSYYRQEREENETVAERLNKENLSCRSVQEWLDLSYRDFEEDKYGDSDWEG